MFKEKSVTKQRQVGAKWDNYKTLSSTTVYSMKWVIFKLDFYDKYQN